MSVPVLDERGETALVLHRTEDVTDYAQELETHREDREERRRRAGAVAGDLVARAREVQDLNRQLREANERERHVALSLQRAMLSAPHVELVGLDVAARYRPAENRGRRRDAARGRRVAADRRRVRRHGRGPKAEVPFPRRATLVLYTDGLIERRGRPIDDGLAALADVVRAHVALDVERLADALLDELGEAGHAPDDTALVIARSTS